MRVRVGVRARLRLRLRARARARASSPPVLLGDYVAASVEGTKVGVVRAEHLGYSRSHDDARLVGGRVRGRVRVSGQWSVGRGSSCGSVGGRWPYRVAAGTLRAERRTLPK